MFEPLSGIYLLKNAVDEFICYVSTNTDAEKESMRILMGKEVNGINTVTTIVTSICEHCFSTLGDLKTKKKNKLKVSNCNHYLQTYFNAPNTLEGFRDVVYPRAFEIFYKMKNRRNVNELEDIAYHDIRHRKMYNDFAKKNESVSQLQSWGHWLHTQIFIQVADTDDESGISDDNDDETSDDSDDSDAKVQE